MADHAYHLVTCQPEEYDEIVGLWERSGLPVRRQGRDAPEAFARQASLGLQRTIGLRTQDGALVGVAVLTHDGRKGWINRLAIDPAHRRKGLARRVVMEAERWFADEIGLEIWAALIEGDNVDSQATFDALGYHAHDVVYVSKRIRAEA